MRPRRGLRAGLGQRVPATVEEDEHDADPVLVREVEESVHALEETLGSWVQAR